MKLLVTLFLLLLSLNANSGWYTFQLTSKHTNTDTPHNERNYGAGIEGDYLGGNLQFGIYRNSYWKNSAYVFTELTSIPVYDKLRFRVNVGMVTGYRYPITPMALPVWTYEGKEWGFDALTIPAIGGRMGVYGIQFKVRF